jgi:hypothetical protein
LEKRLPLFLFLALLILFAWNLMHPRAPEPAASEPGPQTEQAAAEPAVVSAPPQLAPDVADTEERTETLTLGAPGQPGYWRMVVSNRGA